tara:strand:+ start:13 stop:1734 length:1722 start_codon:yes stop_codon:yes gene_type:complete
MNIFDFYQKKIAETIKKNVKTLKISEVNFNGMQVDLAPEKFNCDISTNIAMLLAKRHKKDLQSISENLKNLLIRKIKDFRNIEIAGSGFLNITLKENSILKIIEKILKDKNNYGSQKQNKKINIEFVSANPTGPMHIGHCRGAVLGDVISNLLLFNGNKVIKEYYVNDYGEQINNFVKSVYLRIREIKFKESFQNEPNLYPGDYIIDIARNILKSHPKLNVDVFENCFDELKNKSLKLSMNSIKKDLKSLGIEHNNFVSETYLVNEDLVNKTINLLKKDNHIEEGFLHPPKGVESKNWKKIKRLIFKSTKFGDDNDRALQKNDGSWTYFANDIGYHNFKISKKYDLLINILGADHTGYIKRIKAAVEAISNGKTKLNCKVSQLVKLFKDGKPFKMSKRAGDFVTLNEFLKEVDKDAIRFMMLNRSSDVELEFDFAKVIEKTKENPIFYVQYANARINSIFRSLKKDKEKKILLSDERLDFNDYEKKILRKTFEWPKIVENSSSKLEPHRITFYLYELSTLFHSFWSKGNEDEKYRIITDGKLNKLSSLLVLQLLSSVIRNGMQILGVSLPEKM